MQRRCNVGVRYYKMQREYAYIDKVRQFPTKTSKECIEAAHANKLMCSNSVIVSARGNWVSETVPRRGSCTYPKKRDSTHPSRTSKMDIEAAHQSGWWKDYPLHGGNNNDSMMNRELQDERMTYIHPEPPTWINASHSALLLTFSPRVVREWH